VTLPVCSKHLLQEVGLLVVDGVVRPQRQRLLALLLAARGGDDPRAEQPRDLDAGAAHARAGGVDEHRLAGLQLGPGDQRVPGGEEDERNAGGLLEGHVPGLGKHVGRRNRDLLGVPASRVLTQDGVLPAKGVPARQALLTSTAGEAGVQDHLHARRDAGVFKPGTHRLDHACDVGTQDVRHVQKQAWPARSNPDVEVVERDGAHPDNHPARLGHRIVHLGHLEHLGATVGPHHHRLHRHLLLNAIAHPAVRFRCAARHARITDFS
jgi:hypothetical protein